jgi:hypothetical protein
LTEDIWLTSDSPNVLLHYLRPWGRHRRKLQLYVCGWYRHSWRFLNEPCRQLVEICERAAGGLASPGRVAAAKRAVTARAREEFAENSTDGLADVGRVLLLSLRLEHLPGWKGLQPSVYYFEGTEEQRRRNEAEHAALARVQLDLLREIVGNPFRRSTFDPAWRSSAVGALVRGVYEDRAFDQLPILADALEETGCEDAQLLGHFRGLGPHNRGCWALDLVLGQG